MHTKVPMGARLSQRSRLTSPEQWLEVRAEELLAQEACDSRDGLESW